MREIALFYNFSEERLRKARFALLPLKISVKAVAKEDFNQPLGYLVGIKEIAPADTPYDGEGFEDEMLVLHNFTNKSLDSMLRALSKCGVGRVPLKAVVTPTNKDWNSVELHKAVKADHEQMTAGNQTK